MSILMLNIPFIDTVFLLSSKISVLNFSAPVRDSLQALYTEYTLQNSSRDFYRANTSDTEAPFLDLNLCVSNGYSFHQNSW